MPPNPDNARHVFKRSFAMRTAATPLVLALVIAAWAIPASADPPAQAPAHGWRKKHDRDDDERHERYEGYEGEHWERDYAVLSGRCDRHAVATALGGVVGAAVGSRLADSGNRTIATLVGATVGALLGNQIGRQLDEADRGCFGHALELGRPGRVVAWTNDAVGVRYELLPGATRERHGAVCREFTMTSWHGRERVSRAGVACRAQAGRWEIEG
jgi:surface antigen